MIDESEYLIPGFLPEERPLRIDAVMEYDGGTWGLYINRNANASWIVSRARYNNIAGWRVTTIPNVVSIEWAKWFVYYHRCGQCDE